MIISMGIRIADLLFAARRWGNRFRPASLACGAPHACWISTSCTNDGPPGSRFATPIAASHWYQEQLPPHGLEERIDQMRAWLDANCGA
jgi:hypothetical protein